VASRSPLSLGPLAGSPMPDRWLHVRGSGLPVEIGGLYLPGEAGGRKPAFWAWLRSSASYLVDRPAILIGDLNTGRRNVDECGATFLCAEDFDALLKAGWIDAWRTRHPDSDERSWWSVQGNGFRLDHVFATESANRLVTQAEYVTDVDDVPLVRVDGYRIKDGGVRPLSDHAALVVDIGAGAASPI
jgi:exonuclease III